MNTHSTIVEFEGIEAAMGGGARAGRSVSLVDAGSSLSSEGDDFFRRGRNSGNNSDSEFDDEDILGNDDDDDDDDDSRGTNNISASDGQSVASGMRNKEENKFLQRMRQFVVVLFVYLAILVPLVVFITTRNTQVNQFENAFDALSDQVTERIREELARKITAINSLAISATSFATSTNSTWPFVTQWDYDLRAHSAMALSDALSIGFHHYVTREQRAQWEDYTEQNLDWLLKSSFRDPQSQSSRHLQDDQQQQQQEEQENSGKSSDNTTNFYQEISLTEYGTVREIYQYNQYSPTGVAQSPNDDYYFVNWQIMPLDSNTVNFNQNGVSSSRSAIEHVLQDKQAFIADVAVLDNTNDIVTSLTHDYYQALKQFFYETRDPTRNVAANDPISVLYYPVFQDFTHPYHSNDIVAVISSVFLWETFFTLVLPPSSKGIMCVVTSTCGAEFSFEIDGPAGIFLGYSDEHDADFEYLGDTISLTELSKDLKDSGAWDLPDTATPLDDHYCQYDVNIYPTQTLQEKYLTNRPALYAVGVAAAFLVISIISLTYDCLVQRRMRRIIKAAKENRAIVAQMFPEGFRDKLLQLEAEETKGMRVGGVGGANDRLSAAAAAAAGGGNDNAFTNNMDEYGDAMVPSKLRLKNFLVDKPLGAQAAAAHKNATSEDLLVLYSKPIADLFLHCTVLFSDISGFSAWSSEREPEQVFLLLETIFQAFDHIAKRRKVFKVETIGDSYVAVTGLPDPQHDHAVRMARFARDCLQRVNEVTQGLETTLGPDTGDLKLRFGLNSGQVTAGVLRGQKSRFQLFGDTVNTAARMESTGLRNRIQISQSTAKLLQEAGKDTWIQPREDVVHAKGKGTIQTYWLLPQRFRNGVGRYGSHNKPAHFYRDDMLKFSGTSSRGNSSADGLSNTDDDLNSRSGFSLDGFDNDGIAALWGDTGSDADDNDNDDEIGAQSDDDGGVAGPASAASEKKKKKQTITPSLTPFSRSAKNKRLIEWLVELLLVHIKQIVAERQQRTRARNGLNTMVTTVNGSLTNITSGWGNGHHPDTFKLPKPKDQTVLEEVVEAFQLAKFDAKTVHKRILSPEQIQLDDNVVQQLRGLITELAGRYRNNPFHNFEHASHVTMSSLKLLKRIVAPEDINYNQTNVKALASEMHNYTYGITSDALAQFAVAFSALIHDVDHTGVPNGQLIKENPELGVKYKGRSVAEQNSVDLAWDMLMQPKNRALQECLFANEKELLRFRQMVVNCVMATDIFEKEMKQLRNQRWDKAFHKSIDDETSVTAQESNLSGSRGRTDSESLASGRMSFTAMVNNNNISSTEQLVHKDIRATIVIEHIIQASDVSHTMQHWNVYKKWNERLFQEMYAAYDAGRSASDPSLGWYKGELWFYDNYIIPLAMKLEECGVFGVSSDECLNYALDNRKEWAVKGKQIVEEMKNRYQKRKRMEVGGFTPEEIEAFSPKELDYIVKILTKKGRTLGTFRTNVRSGRINAAQAWMDALEIYERSPVAHSMQNQAVIFPVFSGIMVYVKGGVIEPENRAEFEQKLSYTFLQATQAVGEVTHYLCALALNSAVQFRLGDFEKSQEYFKTLQATYNPNHHSQGICKTYGTDKVAQSFSVQALDQFYYGNHDKAWEMCTYVMDKILPVMNPSNVLNANDLLFPLVPIYVARKEYKTIRDKYNSRVIQNFYEFKLKRTLCKPIMKPLLMLLDMLQHPAGFDWSDTISWLLSSSASAAATSNTTKKTGNGCIFDSFIDKYYATRSWSPNIIIVQLCLEGAKIMAKSSCLQDENNDENDTIRALLHKGLEVAHIVQNHGKNPDGSTYLPVTRTLLEPIHKELMELASKWQISYSPSCNNEGNSSETAEETKESFTAETTNNNTSNNNKKVHQLRTSFGLIRLQLEN